MLRVTCDCCGKEVFCGENHHVVKVEVFTTNDPATVTEADLDKDHMEAIAEMLCEAKDGEQSPLEPRTRQFRYDLCDGCLRRYVRDPLGRETAPKFHFSAN